MLDAIKSRIVSTRHSLKRIFWMRKVSLKNFFVYQEIIKQVKSNPHKCNGKVQKIACILDEFSFESIHPEAQFKQLNANHPILDLENFQPDLLFIESAWRGLDNAWIKKVSEVSNELIEVLEWARSRRVPTVFWHKEVPPHFKTFMTVSRLFDYVFLTDQDCIERYQKALGHNRVHLLLFACQPKMNNPLSDIPRKDALFFAGTFYPKYKYPERHQNFTDLFDVLHLLIDFEIYDRSNGKGRYIFPDKYKPYIKGSLPFEQMKLTYKTYTFGLTLNSVKHSSTMFARRALELMASNTLVIGNTSKAIQSLFGDLTVSSDDPEVVKSQFLKLQSPDYGAKIRLMALRKVLSQHTYQHRMNTIYEILGAELEEINKKILVVGVLENQQDLNHVITCFEQQDYNNKHLIILNQTKQKLAPEGAYSIVESWKEIQVSNYAYCSVMNANHFYGKFYLTDLANGFLFADTDATTKTSYFEIQQGKNCLNFSDQQYKKTNQAWPDRSIFDISLIDQIAEKVLQSQPLEIEALSLDPYHFIANPKAERMLDSNIKEVSDLDGVDMGRDFSPNPSRG